MKKVIVLLCVMFLVIGCNSTSRYILEDGKSVSPVGQMYYTKANMCYERQNQILSINWHLGAILPAGTQVKVVGYGKDKIRFEVSSMSASFTLINAKRYSTINLEMLFKQYFSKDDIYAQGGLISNFTQEEQENIKKGIISEGMSKEAVLVSYGYPPSHRTPNTKLDYWEYWKNKFKRDIVYFQYNKVVKIEHTMRPGR